MATTDPRPLVLVTNDDGIDAPGIAALARTLESHDFRVVVVAPATDMSGASAAIGPVDPHIGTRRTQLEGLQGSAYAVQSPPAMIVIAALNGAFGEVPLAIASGVNNGLNLGRAVLHSGTVGAALTGQNLGLPALAVSVEPGGSADIAAQCGVDVFADLWTQARPLMANVNVPAGATTATPRVRTQLARFGAVTAAVNGDALDFRLTIDPSSLDDPGSDGAAVHAGNVSVTIFTGFVGYAGAESEITLETVAPSGSTPGRDH